MSQILTQLEEISPSGPGGFEAASTQDNLFILETKNNKSPSLFKKYFLFLVLIAGLALFKTFKGFVHHKSTEKASATLLEKKEEDTTSLFSQAMNLYQAEKWEEALNEFKKISVQGPNDVGVLINMALAFKKNAQGEEAQKYLLLALKFDPSNAIAYNNLGVLYTEKEDFKSAQKLFEKSLNLSTDTPETFLNLAFTFEKMGQYTQAIQTYDEYIKNKKADSKLSPFLRDRIRRLVPLSKEGARL